MQVERSGTQHGGYMHSLPLARSTCFPLCTDSAPRERQWGLLPQAALRLPAVMHISPLRGFFELRTKS
ncbi:MAG: hypothetical protein LBU42_02925 [Prevotellaceae bacterium]|nr:hypothetical protein [Prevotellaceae bacterium]